MTTLATNIIPGDGGTILDPCCGTGEPLAWLGEKLGLTTYGNELHPARFAQARDRLDYCLNGAREFLDVAGAFTVIFDNPPYDQSLSGQRMEVEHLRHDLALLTPNGLGLWVIPEPIIDYELCSLLAGQLHQVNIRRFPQPEYDRFKQVIIFGLKRRETAHYTYAEATALEAQVNQGPPVLQADEFSYRLDAVEAEPISRFSLAFPEAGTVLTEIEMAGVQHSDTWQTLFDPQAGGLGHFQPVLRLSAGHTAMVIAAGIVDGTAVEIEGDPHLIKGSTDTRITVIR